MIVTVTLNTAIDRTLLIKDFLWNQTIRASQSALGMGGKAADASWILSELGYRNCAMGFAAGTVGRQMKKMLEDRGGETDLVWVKGETRTNIVVISEAGKSQSTLVSNGLEIKAKDVAVFRKKYTARISKATCVLIGGSVPQGISPTIYTELVEEARQAGLPVVFDASGPGLKAGLEGRPTIVKPNIDEISDLAGRKVTTVDEAYHAAKELKTRYGSDFIVTLGHEGALAILANQSYFIPVLKIPVVSSAGAGDGVLAGVSAALATGKTIEEGLCQGFAAAAAVCLTLATADCRREDVNRLQPQIQLIRYP